MKDIEIAKNLLTKEDLTLVIVKNGEVIYMSNKKGISPLFWAVKDVKESLKDSSVADKVIGKAAAMLCSYAGINELHTNVVSEKAIEILNRTKIMYQYENLCSFIKNRDNTGICPVEALALNTESIEELLTGIQKFLINISNEQRFWI